MTMIAYICISGSFGILITMTALLCVTVNGPISMNITGIFKDVFLTVIGFVMFADAKVTQSTIIGVSFSMIGAIYFCWTKYQSMMEADLSKTNTGKVGKKNKIS